MEQVEKLCDAICLMDQGRAVLEGTMRAVKSRYPRDRVVVEYEGDASFLDRSVDHANCVSLRAEPSSSCAMARTARHCLNLRHATRVSSSSNWSSRRSKRYSSVR